MCIPAENLVHKHTFSEAVLPPFKHTLPDLKATPAKGKLTENVLQGHEDKGYVEIVGGSQLIVVPCQHEWK